MQTGSRRQPAAEHVGIRGIYVYFPKMMVREVEKLLLHEGVGDSIHAHARGLFAAARVRGSHPSLLS